MGHTAPDQQHISNSNTIFEGSRHPNFMNPFEYVKSFHNKSFPTRIGTLTQPNTSIFRGGPLVFRHAQIGWS